MPILSKKDAIGEIIRAGNWFSFSFSIILSVNVSQPLFLCEKAFPFSTVNTVFNNKFMLINILYGLSYEPYKLHRYYFQ